MRAESLPVRLGRNIHSFIALLTHVLTGVDKKYALKKEIVPPVLSLYLEHRSLSSRTMGKVPPPFGSSPLAWRPPTLRGAPMLAIGAGGRGGLGEHRVASRRQGPALALDGAPTLAIGLAPAHVAWSAHARHWPGARPRCV